MKFKDFYNNRPEPVTVIPDTDTKLFDQSEADRCSLKYQLERYGMDSLQQQLQKTMSQFGFADTRLTKDFVQLQQEMAEANSYFMALPSRVRAQYNHDASKFFTELDQNPKKAYDNGFISKDLAIKLGVIKQPESLTPAKPVGPSKPVGPVEPSTSKVDVETPSTDNVVTLQKNDGAI